MTYNILDREPTELDKLCRRKGLWMEAKFGMAEKKSDDPHMVNNWRVNLAFNNKKEFYCDFYGGSAVKSITVGDVVSSLCLDASAGEMDFEEFCSEFGYDEDSRKAFSIWESCRNQGTKFREFVGETLFKVFSATEH